MVQPGMGYDCSPPQPRQGWWGWGCQLCSDILQPCQLLFLILVAKLSLGFLKN